MLCSKWETDDLGCISIKQQSIERLCYHQFWVANLEGEIEITEK